MKYSVLMSLYKNDNPSYLGLALDSMINQTVKPDEIVLVKDGPIPRKLQKIIDDRKKSFRFIKDIQLRQNVGLGLALNEGIKECKNELIARMDADDISDPTRCEKQVSRFISNNNLDIVGCLVKEFSGEVGNIVGRRDVPLNNDEIHKYARRRDPFNHPTVMYKKSSVLKVGGYGDYRKNQDTDLWIRMLHDGCMAENINEYLLLFRFDDDTYRKRKSWVNTKLLIKIRRNGYKIGFSSLNDYFTVATAQLALFCMPIWLQKLVYKKILRKAV
ncbi:glycosyltransferase [Candidatus Saccharibacteria bacterium]|nr:glycosyltransferase [Candidatus Saccharibacteria bacterium]